MSQPAAPARTGAPPRAPVRGAAVARTERKRTITRWNRRLGIALVVVFPLSYLTSWLHEQYTVGALGSWLSALNVLIQVVSTLILFAHAAYSFYVFGFPSPRANLRTLNGYAAYFVLLVFMLSQTAVGVEPMHTWLTWISFTLIAAHVVVAWILRRSRGGDPDDNLRKDVKALLSPDAEVLHEIAERRAEVSLLDGTPALEARRVSTSLGTVQVLFDVNLRVLPGQVVALLGNNGAGKTTTLRTLAGLERATDGSILLDGDDVTPLTPAGRSELGLGLVVGGRAVFAPLTVQENLEVFSMRLPADQQQSAVGAALEAFPWLAERAQQRAGTLSGGEQQMLAVAQAFVTRPRILMIDEFSLGLAPKIVEQLADAVRVIADAGSAVLVVEQSAPIALGLADHVLVMERGRITLSEPVGVLTADPSVLTRAYLSGGSDSDQGATTRSGNPAVRS
jgi:branched-chain amino acid transport system ATP-binding protein